MGLIIFLFISHFTTAQILHPANWTFRALPTEESPFEGGSMTLGRGGIYDLQFAITLDPSWYIYSTDQNPDLGAIPTRIEFEQNDTFKLIGDPLPVKVKEKYDDIWEGNIRIIAESGGGFTQKVKLLTDDPVITGTISYSVCSIETGQCVISEKDFQFKAIPNNK